MEFHVAGGTGRVPPGVGEGFTSADFVPVSAKKARSRLRLRSASWRRVIPFCAAAAIGAAQVAFRVQIAGSGRVFALQPNNADLAIPVVLLYTLAVYRPRRFGGLPYRRARLAALQERAARLEAERDAQVQIAVAAERACELPQRRAQVRLAALAGNHAYRRRSHQ